MPRPKKVRRVCFSPRVTYYKPRGVPLRELRVVELTREEVEVLRLKNIEKLNQNECSVRMKTSQSTVQRILHSAYQKLSIAVIEGMAIKIT